MITDARVFDDEYLPRELVHRDGELDELGQAFQPAVDGDSAEDVLVSGPSGVGKTALARYALDQLLQHADADRAYIRCLGSSEDDVLQAALEQHRSSTPTSSDVSAELLRTQLKDVVEYPYVVVLDEADALRDTNAVSSLVDVPEVSVVAICHEPDRWLARAPRDVQDGLRRRLELGRYSTNELADILDARARQGLASGVVTSSQMERIADEVAGVARYGVQALQASAEIAEEREGDQILDEDVDASFERARQRIRSANLESLTFHHHVLYALVYDGGRVTAQELNERYERFDECLYRGYNLMPVGKRSRRNKLKKLREYDLVDYEGPRHNRVYFVRDESIETPVDVREEVHI